MASIPTKSHNKPAQLSTKSPPPSATAPLIQTTPAGGPNSFHGDQVQHHTTLFTPMTQHSSTSAQSMASTPLLTSASVPAQMSPPQQQQYRFTSPIHMSPPIYHQTTEWTQQCQSVNNKTIGQGYTYIWTMLLFVVYHEYVILLSYPQNVNDILEIIILVICVP